MPAPGRPAGARRSRGVVALRVLGATVAAVTGRGSYGEDRAEVVRDIAVWAGLHGIAFDGVHCGRPKSGAGCDVYVDDSPDDVAALRAAGCFTVVFGQPWNEGLMPPRAAGWHDLPDVLVASSGLR